MDSYPTIKNAHLVGGGWDILLLKLYGYIENLQTHYVELKPELQTQFVKCAQIKDANGDILPSFNVKVCVLKEKFSTLRIYLDVTASELDWNTFDKNKYDIQFKRNIDRIYGYISALESISGIICETCGERGARKDCNGWLKTLCEKCYTERMAK